MRFGRVRTALARLLGEGSMGGGKVRPWELSSKREVPSATLVRHDSDQVGCFVLALSLAFNDLKGMVLFEQYLSAIGRPAESDWSATAGQWRGATVQIHRWIAGVLYELMVVIKDNKATVLSSEIGKVVATLSKEAREAWEELVNAANDNTGDTSKLLLRIRNNASFHYDPHSLGEGFKQHFVLDARAAPAEANRSAQYSFGPDMDGTRFYYADAAAQRKMMLLGLQFGAPETDRALLELAARVNLALAPLIAAFIAAREGEQTRAMQRGDRDA